MTEYKYRLTGLECAALEIHSILIIIKSLDKMLLQTALHISFFLFAASVAALPSSDANLDGNHLSFSREEIDALKLEQRYPPGYVHRNITFGTGDSTVIVPVVEGDISLLGNDGIIQARNSNPFAATLPSQCTTFTATKFCIIFYCWRDNSNMFVTAWITIQSI